MKKKVVLILAMAMFTLAGFSQIVITQSTGLMAEPSLKSKRLATVFEGDKVTLFEKSGEFWKINVDKKTGYVHETCLSNYADPNKKDEKMAVAQDVTVGKVATGQAVTLSATPDSALIVFGPKNRLYYQGKLLKEAGLKALLITNPEANAKWQARNVLYISGLVLAGVGGGIVGGSLGSGNIGAVLIGVGVAGAGIGCAALSDGLTKKAINIYNQGIAGKRGSVSLRLGMAEHGYGLTLRF